ncbi:MAG: response regulator [Acidobacteriota bacterium]|nr:response regulator [Acidobacteriota bacterium]
MEMNSQKATILVVDDEEMLRVFISKALLRNGYQVLTACDGPEALGICEQRHAEIDLLLTDLTMPRMSGDELAATTSENWPEIRTLMISGYPNQRFLEEKRPEWRNNFLEKPFTMDELAGKVQQVLNS